MRQICGRCGWQCFREADKASWRIDLRRRKRNSRRIPDRRHTGEKEWQKVKLRRRGKRTGNRFCGQIHRRRDRWRRHSVSYSASLSSNTIIGAFKEVCSRRWTSKQIVGLFAAGGRPPHVVVVRRGPVLFLLVVAVVPRASRRPLGSVEKLPRFHKIAAKRLLSATGFRAARVS